MNRVLVVEDEEMIRKGIVLTVDWKALDCEVAGEAANGEEGLAAAERLKPDIIITDLKMPKMDGIAMLTELRKRGCTSKVIILTAYNSFSYARSALRLGAVDFLLKPYHDGELEEAILRLRELYPEDDAEEAAGEAAAGSGTADPGASETAVGTVSGCAWWKPAPEGQEKLRMRCRSRNSGTDRAAAMCARLWPTSGSITAIRTSVSRRSPGLSGSAKAISAICSRRRPAGPSCSG